jgi:hypothetical protein
MYGRSLLALPALAAGLALPETQLVERQSVGSSDYSPTPSQSLISCTVSECPCHRRSRDDRISWLWFIFNSGKPRAERIPWIDGRSSFLPSLRWTELVRWNQLCEFGKPGHIQRRFPHQLLCQPMPKYADCPGRLLSGKIAFIPSKVRFLTLYRAAKSSTTSFAEAVILVQTSARPQAHSPPQHKTL